MSSIARVASWFCVALLALSPPAAGIKCLKTVVGSTPHEFDCGPLARACRIIVKPYKVQNDSAVTDCIDGQLNGRYVYDCAVECPQEKSDWNWNEVECCSGNMCNNGADLNKYAKCYVSKSEPSAENDRIQTCQQPDRCGINVRTKATRCATMGECKTSEWKCCSGDNCFNKWGVEKLTMDVAEEESTDATNLTPSAALSAFSLLILAAQQLIAVLLLP